MEERNAIIMKYMPFHTDSFELFSQSNSLNRIKCPGKDFHFEVSNHYGYSTQNKTRLYKRISNK